MSETTLQKHKTLPALFECEKGVQIYCTFVFLMREN